MRFGKICFLLCLFLIAVHLTGCATTGQGDFPGFNYERDDKSLAVLPPLGFASNELRGDFMAHLNLEKLRESFESVKVIPSSEVKEILGENYAGERVTREQGKKVAEASGADLVFTVWIHDYVVEQFLTTETRTLYETKTDYRTVHVDSEDSEDTGDSEITENKQRTVSREIPVDENQVRVVLSVSALVYDVEKEAVIWRGRRIERSQGRIEHVSALELTDLVIKRIMDRICERLTG
ncbi:MAG: hypothetical protein ACLFN5_04910 [bacterium]